VSLSGFLIDNRRKTEIYSTGEKKNAYSLSGVRRRRKRRRRKGKGKKKRKKKEPNSQQRHAAEERSPERRGEQ
jgi:hypothetical protein